MPLRFAAEGRNQEIHQRADFGARPAEFLRKFMKSFVRLGPIASEPDGGKGAQSATCDSPSSTARE
jgi:hypothetical protein